MRPPSLLALAVAAALVLATQAAAGDLTLSVAVSMKDAVEEIGRGFAAARPGVSLRYNLGASGELQKQIEAGAPVDVFVSAAQRQMDELERAGLVLAGTRRAIARNVLVVVKAADATIDLARPDDLAGRRVGRLVIGNPKTVPAGQYAEESLKVLGLWPALQPRLVFAENVRQALEYVARGEVDAGIVYATDVATRPGRVREAFRLPEDTYRPVVYPAAVVTASRQRDLALAFVAALASPGGRAALARFGFLAAPAGAR
ncbi:MAG: molybdate ABC transporter substrate-binding protein [Candidatus Rokubacteria bacterium]|nr:molybdate ABC transporter substrate-binding protein [Candidatus Rokubacteria bacterium]MBI3825130.1 molybdate ABC transporter substrate-binding protein [Candidatus Rokubacteria bacterium]